MATTTQIESLTIAEQWLARFSYSAATWNLDEHMDLISREMQVHGLPKGGIIDYDGFKRRRSNEFTKKLLLSLTYKGVLLLNGDSEQIAFAVKETVKSTRGESYVLDKELTLRRENDGKWRAVQEQIKYITRK
jgi:hypothetical protein